MANAATARSLTGLVNDLSDDELVVLTKSETRPALKRFLLNPDAFLAFEKANGEKEESQKSKSEFPPPVITPYTITVRHGETFAQRIKRLACSWLHPWITDENTPVAVDKKKGNEDKEVFTVHFNRSIESGDAVAAMAALDPPLKPVIHEDLIAFSTDHKDVLREYPIVQLGSSWVHPNCGRVVSYLRGFARERLLDLSFWDGVWRGYFRFLAVRA